MRKLIYKAVALMLMLVVFALPSVKPASAEVKPMVAAGSNHSLALKSDGTVWAWGSNSSGQFGDGTKNDEITPTQIQNLFGSVTVAGGGSHSLVLKSDGTVWACGENYYGQLGDGTTDGKLIPVQVQNLSGVVAISAGSNHSLALKSDGTVWAWGRNDQGQLGDGTTTNKTTPIQVNNLSGIVAIAVGKDHSLALKSNGTVWAWGDNYYGQLGNGQITDRTLPVQVQGLYDVVVIAAGDDYSLAIKSDGTVWAWGRNEYGQLGDGTTVKKIAPVQVNGLPGVVAIAAGFDHSLALKSDGTVWGWGRNNTGQLGDGTAMDRLTPAQVQNISGIVAIAAGGLHSLAVKSDGTVWAWGYNGMGRLGDGTTTNRNTPVQVQGLNLLVSSVTLESITVIPDALNLLIGQKQHLTVTAQMSDGSSQDVTAQASYTSSNSSIASVSQSGLVTANSAGVATITVTYQGKTATVSVLSALPVAVVDYLTVTPNSVSLPVGDSQPLTVMAHYSDGNTKDVTALAGYQVSDPTVVGVSGGQVTALNIGSAVVTASYEGKSASGTVNVTSEVESISVEPNSVPLQAGGNQQLTVTAHYSDGTTADVTGQASYQTNDQAVASISSGGMVAGIAPGSTTVTVSYEGKTASVLVTVAGAENLPSEPNVGPVVVSPQQRPGAPVIGSRPVSNPVVAVPPQRPGATTIGTRPASNPVVAPVERLTGTPSPAVTQPSRQTGNIAVIPSPPRPQGPGHTVISKTR